MRSLSLNTIFLAGLVAVGLWISSSFVDQQVYATSRIRALIRYELFSGKSDQWALGHRRGRMVYFFWKIRWVLEPAAFKTRLQISGYLMEKNIKLIPPGSKPLLKTGRREFSLLVTFLISFTTQGFRSQDKNNRLLGLLVTIAFTIAFLSKEFQGKSLWLLSAGVLVLLQKEDLLNYLTKALPGNRININAFIGRHVGNSSERLRIALVVGELGQGGAEKQAFYLAKALLSLQVDVRVYCLRQGGDYQASLLPTWVSPGLDRSFRPPARPTGCIDSSCIFIQTTHYPVHPLLCKPLFRGCGLVLSSDFDRDCSQQCNL